MADLSELAEMVADDPELVPEIVAVDARIAMKVSRVVLGSILDRANAVIPAKEIVPGTAYARLDAHLGDENSLGFIQVTASDGVQTIAIKTDQVTVSVGGTALLPAKRLIEVLRLAPVEEISFVIVGNAVVLRAGRAQWTIQLPTATPTDIVMPTPTLTTVPREAFLNQMIAVARALPTFAARPALHQVQVEKGHATAADGSRVHRGDVLVPADLIFAIPARGLDQVIRMLKASKADTFEVGVHDQGVVFVVEEDVLNLQRMSVPFPKVDELLFRPAIENEARLTVEPKALIEVVRRVRLAADAEHAAIVLAVVPEQKVNGQSTWSLQVRAKDRLGNSASEKIGVQWTGPVAGQNVTVNHRFLTDLLGSIDPGSATLRLGTDTKTTKKPVYVEDSESGFTAVVQQMRSDWLH